MEFYTVHSNRCYNQKVVDQKEKKLWGTGAYISAMLTENVSTVVNIDKAQLDFYI